MLFYSFIICELGICTWLEVNISVQSQEKSVLSPDLLLLVREIVVVLQHVAKEVVHVHALRPALLVSGSQIISH